MFKISLFYTTETCIDYKITSSPSLLMVHCTCAQLHTIAISHGWSDLATTWRYIGYLIYVGSYCDQYLGASVR